jgi:hypothetical protein
MDELFEILTLLHTGQTDPVPVVLIDRPGGTFWTAWRDFMAVEVLAEGYLSPGDDVAYYLCDNVEDAVREVTSFYCNYLGCVTGQGEALVDVRYAPSAAEFARLAGQFSHLAFTVGTGARGSTVRFDFNGRNYATLRGVINEVNTWG